MRRPALLKAVLLGVAGAALARRNKARQSERELWKEATETTSGPTSASAKGS